MYKRFVDFTRTLSSYKEVLLGTVFFALLFSAAPLHIAYAGFWDGLLNVIAGALDVMVGSVAAVIKVIAELIANGMEAFVRIFMEIPVSPSHPDTPQVIKSGFNISRQIVNIFFILILAFIGLSTILRLQSYQMQKTLPSLIIIALLVNFSGLLVGFMADIGNIITNALLNLSSAVPVWNLGSIPVISGAEGLGTHIVEIIYYLVSTLIYFIVILLFGVRVLMLWTLTIVAPLAAGAYILPATRKYWSQWLKQLIQWSLIGIPISFTLMLSKQVMSGGFTDIPALSESALTNLAAPFTALFLLAAGVFLSMQMAPAGAQGVIKFGMGVPGRLGETRLGSKILSKTATGVQKVLSRESGLIQGPRQFLEKRGGKVGKAFTWATRQTAGRAFGGANRAWGGKLTEYAAGKRRMTLPKNFDQMSEPELEAWSGANHLGNEDLVQLAARMQGKGKYKHTTDSFKEGVVKAMPEASKQRWLHPEIGSVLDVTPEAATEEVLRNMKVLEADPKNRAKVESDFQNDINDETRKIATMARANPALEADIKKWEGVNPGKTRRDLAAAKMYARGLKPQDIPNVVHPKSLALRLAMPESNPANLQRLQDSHDHATLEYMFTEPGGLNDVVTRRDSGGNVQLNKSQDALDDFYKKGNPRLARALFTTPALMNLDWEGRNYMRGPDGDTTDEFAEYLKWLRGGPTGGPTPPAPGTPPPTSPPSGPTPGAPPSGAPPGPPTPSTPPPPSPGGPTPTPAPGGPTPGGPTTPPTTPSREGPFSQKTVKMLRENIEKSIATLQLSAQLTEKAAQVFRDHVEREIQKRGVSPGPSSIRRPLDEKGLAESIILPLRSVMHWAKRENQEALLANQESLNMLVAETKRVHAERLIEKDRQEKQGKPAQSPAWSTSVNNAYKQLEKRHWIPEKRIVKEEKSEKKRST